MKKLLMVSLMVLLTSISYAQDDSGGASPAAGELFIEITSSPFGRDVGYSSSTTLLNFGQFRARYFLNESLVPRLGIWFSVDESGSQNPSEAVTETEFMFTPGIEYHFINEEGFTSYAALDVIVAGRSIEQTSATGPDVAGTSISSAFITSEDFSTSIANRGYFGVGAYAAVGGDYHFSSRFYLGAEIGFQFMTANTADVEVDGVVIQEGYRFFDAGVSTMNSFRIGFKLLK